MENVGVAVLSITVLFMMTFALYKMRQSTSKKITTGLLLIASITSFPFAVSLLGEYRGLNGASCLMLLYLIILSGGCYVRQEPGKVKKEDNRPRP